MSEKSRWWMLSLYAAYSMLMGAAWCPFSTIPKEAEEFYGKGRAAITLFDLSYMIMYLVTALPTSWLLNYSLRYSIIAASAMLASGTCLRFAAWDNYEVAILGQFIVALGSCMALSSCSTIVELWFPQQEMVFATAIASLSNCVGIGIQLIASAALPVIPIQLGVVAGLSVLELVLMCIFFESAPNSNISELSSNSLWTYLKKWRLLGFLLFSGAAYGTVNAFVGMIYEVLKPSGYSSLEVGLFGLVLMSSGMVGGVWASFILAKFEKYSRALQIYLLVGMVGSVALCAAVLSFASMIVVTAIYGFGILGFIPLAVRAAVEEDPTLEPSVPTNVIFFSAQIFTLLHSVATLYFQSATELSGLYVLALFTTVCLGLFLVVYQTDISKDEAAKPLKGKEVEGDSKPEELAVLS